LAVYNKHVVSFRRLKRVVDKSIFAVELPELAELGANVDVNLDINTTAPG